MGNPRLIRSLNVKWDQYPMTPDEIHDFPYMLSNGLDRLNRDSKVRVQDRKLILSFLKHIQANQVSIGRQSKYVNTLHIAAAHIRVPFRRAKRRDMEDLMTRLADFEFARRLKDGTVKRFHYSAETMADFRKMVKRFQKFVRYGDTDKETPFPDEVRWLHGTVKANERRDPLYYTDDEVVALIRAAYTVRDKAMISVAGELGPRVGELLLLRVGDVRFDDEGARLSINRGKTGPRTLRLISSATYLSEYVSTHPYRDKDPQAPLWLSTSLNHLNQPLSWVAADRRLKQIARKAGLTKPRAYWYMFRHCSATRNAKYLTDAEMRLMFGWSRESKMPGVYVHLNGGDLEEKYQQVYGSGRPVEPPKPVFAPVICPRCGDKASPGMRFCPKCASPLDEQERAKMAVQDETTMREISELRRLVEKSLNPPASQEGSESSPGRTS